MSFSGKKIGIAVAVLLAAAIIAVCVFHAQNQKNSRPVIGTSYLMDTIVEYKLYGKNAEQAKLALDEALSGIESRMSLYQAGSEIALLNERAGEDYVPLSPDTFDLLQRCAAYGEQSDGVFDVTIAPLTELWGITSEHPRIPDQNSIESMLKLVDYRSILLEEATLSAMLAQKGQAVDLGGIAKGYACDIMRKITQDYEIHSGYLSIGGNLMVIGEKPDGQPFRFGVRDPRGGENDYLAVVTLPNSTMATSGDYERFFEQDGVRYHHILDTKTGFPAKSDLMSVSVVTPDGAYADFMSTYLFIKGKEYTLQNLNSFPCDLVVIDQQRNVYVSKKLQPNFQLNDKTGTYQFQVEP